MTHSARPIVDWLLDPRTGVDPVVLFAGYAERLCAAGVPIARMTANTIMMHPELIGRGLMWSPAGGATSREISLTFVRSQLGQPSPVQDVLFGHRGEMRIKAGDPTEYEAVRDLFKQGLTEYVIVPLALSSQRLAVPPGLETESDKTLGNSFCSIATDRPGGFTDEQLVTFRDSLGAFGLRLQLAGAISATRGLLDVYLGHEAARRVLDGSFHRGTGELIDAVIWYCDLRGFTALVDRSDVHDVMPVLDGYFDAVATPVTRAGGEILKFIGDAMLAIFPIGADGPSRPAAAGLKAALEALDAVEVMSVQRAARHEPLLRIGVALNVGQVMYGNIGASNRLDFTVIGRAVNEAARVESLCKELGVPLLATEPLARALPQGTLASLGLHQLRGVSQPAELFTAPRLRA